MWRLFDLDTTFGLQSYGFLFLCVILSWSNFIIEDKLFSFFKTLKFDNWDQITFKYNISADHLDKSFERFELEGDSTFIGITLTWHWRLVLMFIMIAWWQMNCLMSI